MEFCFSKTPQINFAKQNLSFVFKLLFGNEEDTSFLISFLNAALDLSGEQAINSVITMNPVNERQTKEDKLSIMDVVDFLNNKKSKAVLIN